MTENATSQRIIVGIDGSESSLYALQQAAGLAVPLNCSLDAITAWDYSLLRDPFFAKGSPEVQWSPQSEAHKVLENAVRDAFRDVPLPIRTRAIWGRAAHVLIQESKDARMLVLGSRGHGGFAGLLLGSVSAACAAHAECPVLITHSPKTQEQRA